MSSAQSKLPIAAVAQMRSTSSKRENLMAVAECARLARQGHADMLFLPECFGFMGQSAADTLANAEHPIHVDQVYDGGNDRDENDERFANKLAEMVMSDEKIEVNSTTNDGDDKGEASKISLLAGLQAIARASKLWISAGGMHVEVDNFDEDKRVYNTHIIMDDLGTVKALYRKIHLFDVSIPGKVELRESASTAPGTDMVVCDSPIGKLGVTTCYDVRFPETYIDLVDQGAQVMLVPAAFTVPTGNAHWHILLRARAIEAQSYVLAAAQYGQHNDKRQSFGHSLVVDPWGTVLADAGGFQEENGSKDDPPSVLLCPIDLAEVESVRQRMPISMHRKNAMASMEANHGDIVK